MVRPGDLYGRSLAFPPQVGANGQMLWSEGEPERARIDPDHSAHPARRARHATRFWLRLERYLFEPNTIATLRLIQNEIEQALARF